MPRKKKIKAAEIPVPEQVVTEKPSEITPEMSESDKMTLNAFVAEGLIQDPNNPEKPAINEASPQSLPFKRLSDGMIEGFVYNLGKNGRIDWQSHINPEYLVYPDNDHTKNPFPKVDGLRDLAELRGIECKEVNFRAVSDTMVVVSVKITFIPNNEDPNGRVWEAIADASISNIGDKRFTKYLATMAETRATGRCIREALGIRLCSFEEMAKEDLDEYDLNGEDPIGDEELVAIRYQMKVKGINLESILEEAYKDPKNRNITSLEQLNVNQGKKLIKYLNSFQCAKTEVQ